MRLEVNHWNGAVEPRAVLADTYARTAEADGDDRHGHGHRCGEAPVDLWWARFDAEHGRDPAAAPGPALCREGEERRVLDARRASATARIAELLSSGERVMVVAADGGRRSAFAAPRSDLRSPEPGLRLPPLPGRRADPAPRDLPATATC